MIRRLEYIQKIVPFINKPLIKVLVGVRRSGKTVLLNQIKEILIERGVPKEQIIYINFESYANKKFLKADTLYDYILQESQRVEGKRIYLFFDEIQDVEEWEKLLSSFMVDIDCDLYITGSNSKLLSGELATHIAGRHIHFDIYPFNFREYKEYSTQLRGQVSDRQLFNEYLEFGGLPQCVALSDSYSKKAYIEDIYNTIIINDIVERNKVSDIALLKKLLAFLFDNVGNTFSANSIRKRLAGEGISTTNATIIAYISYIEQAYALYCAKRYDAKGKALLSTNEKYYAVDMGLRNHIKSSELLDYNKLFENVIYLELLARGYQVLVGKVGDYEVDFVCYNANKERIYIQVAYLLADQSTVEREFRPFAYIDDNYPKYVISADEFNFSQNGIKHINIIDFLLNMALL